MKYLLLLILTAVAFTSISIKSHAAEFDPFNEACQGEAANSELCVDKETKDNPVSGSEGVLIRVVNILSFVVGVASVLMVILGGLKYITSNGDATSTANAKNTILYAIIGIVDFAFSQAIILFVLTRI
jgi:hypothetical protein